jgi:hypothetical protein
MNTTLKSMGRSTCLYSLPAASRDSSGLAASPDRYSLGTCASCSSLSTLSSSSTACAGAPSRSILPGRTRDSESASIIFGNPWVLLRDASCVLRAACCELLSLQAAPPALALAMCGSSCSSCALPPTLRCSRACVTSSDVLSRRPLFRPARWAAPCDPHAFPASWPRAGRADARSSLRARCRIDMHSAHSASNNSSST